MKVSRGKAEFVALVDDTRALATQHPTSAHALALLAEVEHNAGNADAALMAAEKAIAINPKHLNAQLQRGIALAALAPKADKPEAAWAKARSQFAKVNRMENDHPVPLIWYFRTFVDQGKRPDDDAIAGLEWALALAPFDLSLRFNVARTQMNLGRMDDALLTLQPLVSNPHNARLRSSAAKLIQAIKAGTGNKTDGDTEAEES
jgi:tetratricopeptide (TPR) repeat protein